MNIKDALLSLKKSRIIDDTMSKEMEVLFIDKKDSGRVKTLFPNLVYKVLSNGNIVEYDYCEMNNERVFIDLSNLSTEEKNFICNMLDHNSIIITILENNIHKKIINPYVELLPLTNDIVKSLSYKERKTLGDDYVLLNQSYDNQYSIKKWNGRNVPLNIYLRLSSIPDDIKEKIKNDIITLRITIPYCTYVIIDKENKNVLRKEY